jgi:O-succinylbenzoate synthase
MLNSLIKSIDVKRESCELKKPYVLSFATLDEIISIQVTVTLENGEKKTTEVVPLVGYNDEDESSILRYLECKNDLLGISLSEARSIIVKDIDRVPFATSPILTAIDLFSEDLPSFNLEELDFVIPFSTENTEEIIDYLSNNRLDNLTIKIKLSGDLNIDKNSLVSLLELNCLKLVKVRLDANQGYNYESCKLFFDFLVSSGIQDYISYVEQPMNKDSWDDHFQIKNDYPSVPIMLDESVINKGDVKKCYLNGIEFVKLKLFKQGGIKETCELIELCDKLGVKVVLGNGVATMMSNDIEIRIHSRYKEVIYGASEANGFMKILAKD